MTIFSQLSNETEYQNMDEYQVGGKIGRGKFSSVYRGIRKSDGIRVAIKRIEGFRGLDQQQQQKSAREIDLAKQLDHENIIRFLDSFMDHSDLVLVFEYAEAGDLKRQLRKANERGARFDERVIWKYFSQIAGAVAYMHKRRIMHRDLKPANIFLVMSGQIKVGDLGLGRELSEDSLLLYSKVGTPLYMSPEVLEGKPYEWKSDVWSLGCLLYELAMLKSPFKEEGLSLVGLCEKISQGYSPKLSPVYSAEMSSMVTSMLNHDPMLRPSAEQVAEGSLKMYKNFSILKEKALQPSSCQSTSVCSSTFNL
jgi:serine/threonine protein kinase